MNLKEKIEDIYDNLSERIKSPFIFTFITVWTFRHWELVYSLFNFEKDCTLAEKLSFIKGQLQNETYDSLLWHPLGWTFTSIGSYYLLQFIAEGIALLYKKWMRPGLYYLLDRNKLATKIELESERKNGKRLDAKNKELEERIKDYIENEEALEKEIENQNKEFEELKSTSEEQGEEHRRMVDTYQQREAEIQRLNDEIGKLNKLLTATSKDLIETQRQEGEASADLTEIFLPGEKWTYFIETGNSELISSKFHLDKKGEFFMIENEPKFLIKDVRIRKAKSYVEFEKSEVGKPNDHWQNRLIIINKNLLLGQQNGNLIYYIKGEHDASNKSKDFPIVLDYRKIFQK